MKLHLPAHETIRVELFDEKAIVVAEHRVVTRYSPYSIKTNQSLSASLVFTVTNLETRFIIPQSQIIVEKNGLPLMFNSTSGSNVPNRFKTDQITDAGLKVEDNIIKMEVKDSKEKNLGTRIIERTWTEEITRVISIRNETGREARKIVLEVSDDPANQIVYQGAEPEPDEINLPTRTWKVGLAVDEERKVTLIFHYHRKEQIEVQPLDGKNK
ncbi:MAG: hypothetical protein ACFFD4_37155 [Candidatus Odinarchaeota archaeon]